MKLPIFAKKLVKSVLYHPPFDRVFLHRYNYQFNPAQLAFLCQCLDQTRDVPGAIVEIGCSTGLTTVFLNKYMDCTGIEKPYICVDTFSGFTPEDIQHEIGFRGKKRDSLLGFRANSREWFERTLQNNGITRVKTIQADIAELSLSSIGEVSFCLIDVDLYRPVRAAIEKIHPQLRPKGMIVVDDCKTGQNFDGALDAYDEMAGKLGISKQIVLDKLGLLYS
jgi:O-methyltransferase